MICIKPGFSGGPLPCANGGPVGPTAIEHGVLQTMKHYMSSLRVAVAVCATVTALGAWAAPDGGTTVAARCASCHNLDDPAALAGKAWELRLGQMRRYDALGDRERTELLAFVREHTHKAESMVAMARDQRLFEDKCGFCHASARIFMVPTTAEDRRHIMLRMREHWEGGEKWISPEEADRIFAYVEQAIAAGTKPAHAEMAGGGKDIFRARCVGCHNMDRIYEKIAGANGNSEVWMHIVERMRAKEPDWISEDEARKIVEYISAKSGKMTTE